MEYVFFKKITPVIVGILILLTACAPSGPIVYEFQGLAVKEISARNGELIKVDCENCSATITTIAGCPDIDGIGNRESTVTKDGNTKKGWDMDFKDAAGTYTFKKFSSAEYDCGMVLEFTVTMENGGTITRVR